MALCNPLRFLRIVQYSTQVMHYSSAFKVLCSGNVLPGSLFAIPKNLKGAGGGHHKRSMRNIRKTQRHLFQTLSLFQNSKHAPRHPTQRPQDAPRRLQDTILVDFWKQNGSQLAPKSNQKSIPTLKAKNQLNASQLACSWLLAFRVGIDFDLVLVPTGFHFGSKNPPKSYLGGVLGHLGAVLGALGGVLRLL